MRTFNFFWKFLTKWQPSTIVDVRNSLSMEFLAISNQYKTFSFLIFFLKMASGAHFWYPKFTFDLISGHFRSMRNLIFVQIFDKMAAVDHFGCPIFTFDRISDHFRSIQNFFFFYFTKWPPIFDVRNSLSISFLAISNRYATFLFWNYWQNGCRRPFWMSDIHFRSHFWPF